MDWVIQKATELGVAGVIPLLSARVIVRPRTGRLPAQVARWQRIALEAAQQSEQWAVPSVSPPQNLTEFLARHCPDSHRLFLTERATGQAPDLGPGQALTKVPLPSGSRPGLVIVVGPEGGWTQEERDRASAAGWTAVTLGPRILRAETAALAALSVLQSRLGELG